MYTIPGILLCLLALPSAIRSATLQSRQTSKSDYISNAVAAAKVLNDNWFDSSNGQWQDYWWNSANALTALADLAAIDSDFKNTVNGMVENVFSAAQASNGGSWLNDYYDDEGW